MRSHRLVKIGVIILGVLVLMALGMFSSQNQAQSTSQVSAEAYAPTDSSAQDSLSEDKVNKGRLRYFIKSKLEQPTDTTGLDTQINTIIGANADIDIGVAIKDLSSDSTHNYGKQAPMTAASITKVLVAVDFMKEVELGHKRLDMIMADGNTAQYDIEQMIVYSDNDAWHVLIDSLTYSQIQAYAESIGLTSYDYSDNSIGTADVTKLLSDMYQRKLINESHAQLLLSYMERANYRGLIVPAVPEFDTVYHKAGWLTPYLHDTAIVTNGNRSVVLTVFTNSTATFDPERVAAIMQQLTTATLQTFHLDTPPKEAPTTP